MNYKEQLSDYRWMKRRQEILQLYQFTCISCGKIKEDGKLDVHHVVYIKNKMAWDYDDYYLVVLCRECHEHLHNGLEILDYSIKIRYRTGESIKNILDILTDIEIYLSGTFGDISDVKKIFREALELNKKIQHGL